MEKNNDFWLTSILYLEDVKMQYLKNSKKEVKRAIEFVFKPHSQSIKNLRSRFNPKMKFLLKDEIKLIIEAFNIRPDYLEVIFVIQEAQQRILSSLKLDTFKKRISEMLEYCLHEGEKANSHIREIMQTMQNEHIEIYNKEIIKSQNEADFKEVGRLKTLIEEISNYEEVTDEASDLIVDLFLTCKIK